MKSFYKGYCSTLYVAFIVYVVVEILNGHPFPLLFALMFLVMWPLVVLMAGYEPVAHVGLAYQKKHNLDEPPSTWPKAVLDGCIAGILVLIMAGVCLWFVEDTTFWILSIPLAALVFLPGLVAGFSIKRLQ